MRFCNSPVFYSFTFFCSGSEPEIQEGIISGRSYQCCGKHKTDQKISIVKRIYRNFPFCKSLHFFPEKGNGKNHGNNKNCQFPYIHFEEDGKCCCPAMVKTKHFQDKFLCIRKRIRPEKNPGKNYDKQCIYPLYQPDDQCGTCFMP